MYIQICLHVHKIFIFGIVIHKNTYDLLNNFSISCITTKKYTSVYDTIHYAILNSCI